MFGRTTEAVRRILNKPLFGTRRIPRDARVDPTMFSEEEFPVCCNKCGYLLRGLPDGRCPECGDTFERGRLLVQQYVFVGGLGSWKRSRSARIAKVCFAIAALACAAVVLGMVVMSLYVFLVLPRSPASPGGSDLLHTATRTFAALMWTWSVALCACVIFAASAFFRNFRGKRRRVLRAIPNDDQHKQTTT